MEAFAVILEKHGWPAVMVLLVTLGLYKGGAEVWNTFKAWGGMLIDQWKKSSDSRMKSDEAREVADAKMLELMRQNAVSDEKRHAEQIERMVELARQNRHAMATHERAIITRVESESRATRRELRELAAVVTGAEAVHDSGDIVPEEDDNG